MKTYEFGNTESPTVLIQPVDDHDMEVMDGEVAAVSPSVWFPGFLEYAEKHRIHADLLFYHIRLRCYFVVELKVKPFDPGQKGVTPCRGVTPCHAFFEKGVIFN